MTDLIREVQAAVGVRADGKPGPQTWQAIHARIIPAPVAVPAAPFIPAPEHALDARSERCLASLHARVRPLARALVEQSRTRLGLDVRIISGTRTFAEQDALFAKGRREPGPRVTNAIGGYSNHNFGLAFDVGIFDEDERYIDDQADLGLIERSKVSRCYGAVGAVGTGLGLEWGGDWKSFADEPHFQLRPEWAEGMSERDMLAVLRAKVAQGKDVFAV
jgi:peptidoglycan LD-endopeptidase CwlK